MKRSITLKAQDKHTDREVTIKISSSTRHSSREEANTLIDRLTDRVVEDVLLPSFHFNSIEKS